MSTALDSRNLVTASRCKDAWRAAGGIGPIVMPKEAWESIHRDYRNADPNNPRCLCLDVDGVTCSVPVHFGCPFWVERIDRENRKVTRHQMDDPAVIRNLCRVTKQTASQVVDRLMAGETVTTGFGVYSVVFGGHS